MTQTVKEFVSANFDGKWAGDSRNTFSMDGDKVILTCRGVDYNTGKSFETKHDGPAFFLLEVSPISTNPNTHPRRRVEVRPHPVRAHGTLEEMLYGVVESTKTDVEALGVAIITEVRNGRGKIKTIWGKEAADALEALAYPELANEIDVSDEPYPS